MLFEETLKEKTVPKPEKDVQVRIDLEPKREFELQKIIKAYGTVKKLSRTKLIKMAIDNLIINIEEQASEEEAIEYLRSLYKEAEF